MLQVGKSAPDFTADAVMPDGSTKKIRLSDYKNKKYVLLFFYPFDFAFVCPTEIISFNKAAYVFERKNVQILGCSIDSTFVHNAWRNTLKNDGGIGKIVYPLISDLTHQIAKNYNVLHDDGMALRGLFLIDKQGVLQHYLVNNLPLGRSVEEALRILTALQNTELYGEVCSANWTEGSDALQSTQKEISLF